MNSTHFSGTQNLPAAPKNFPYVPPAAPRVAAKKKTHVPPEGAFDAGTKNDIGFSLKIHFGPENC